MRISEIKGATSVTSVKKKDRDPTAPGFNELIDGAEETASPATVVGASALTSLDGLLAFQEVDSDERTNQQQIEHGEELLALLDELKLSLLNGNINPQDVHKMLEETHKHHNQTNDPKLKAIIDDIELRAEIELAKIEINRVT